MIAEIIRGHSHALFDIVADQVPPTAYAMSDRTKCLNTAVMLLYALTGEAALDHTRYCDTDTVERRYATEGNRSAALASALASALRRSCCENSEPSCPLSARCESLFYVMITDADLDAGQGLKQYFPGHVFVIERSGARRYQAYQSYVKRYDLEDYLENVKNNTFDDAFVTDIAAELTHMFTTERWDARCSRFWRRFTHAPGERYEGCVIRDRLLLCYRELPAAQCAVQLAALLRRATAKAEAAADVGRAYDGNSHGIAGALTNGEVLLHARQMLRELGAHDEARSTMAS